MIPETSAAARYRKAPHAVQAGDFSSARSVEFATLDRLDNTLLAPTGDEDHIPGAIESTFSLGLYGAWRNGVTASLSLRHLGRSPLIEDNSVRTSTSTLMHAGVGEPAASSINPTRSTCSTVVITMFRTATRRAFRASQQKV